MTQTPDDPSKDSSMRQATIFLREFESLVEKLTGEIQSPMLAECARRRRMRELREVHAQIHRLRTVYPRLPVRAESARGQPTAVDGAGAEVGSLR